MKKGCNQNKVVCPRCGTTHKIKKIKRAGNGGKCPTCGKAKLL
jgi:predicted RNA-binding Zn-ribbon protein involved in translation (DUF1610 family)